MIHNTKVMINFLNFPFIQSDLFNIKPELKIEPFIEIGKSGIKIKKKNRGKFTEYCGGTVTNECIARGKNSPNPAIRKRATFAANARVWKHDIGGVAQLAPGNTQASKLFTSYAAGLGQSQQNEERQPMIYDVSDDLEPSEYELQKTQQEVQPQDTQDSYQGFDMNQLTYGQNSSSSMQSGSFDKDKAASWADSHAHNASTGWCARYVRQALEAGGEHLGMIPYAYMYNDKLKASNRFKPVVQSNSERLPDDYTPDKGDVAVIGRSKSHPYGHIAIYDGQKWVSDFKQKSWHGMKQFEGNDYTIWRHA